ncbi:hypothetical protein C8T65DRAFT_246509 [Cerioporus squamosus]|nr:hypothetical protein C8T65DRAFT_246509 [Cerioporus squamosus]
MRRTVFAVSSAPYTLRARPTAGVPSMPSDSRCAARRDARTSDCQSCRLCNRLDSQPLKPRLCAHHRPIAVHTVRSLHADYGNSLTSAPRTVYTLSDTEHPTPALDGRLVCAPESALLCITPRCAFQSPWRHRIDLHLAIQTVTLLDDLSSPAAAVSQADSRVSLHTPRRTRRLGSPPVPNRARRRMSRDLVYYRWLS